MAPSTEVVPITLDKQRRLRFTFNGLAAFEKEMGKSIPAFLLDFVNANNGDAQAVARNFGIRELRALLWAALLHEDKRLTIERAGDLIDYAEGDTMDEKIASTSDKVLEAFMLFQGGPGAKKKYAEMKAMSSQDATPGTGEE